MMRSYWCFPCRSRIKQCSDNRGFVTFVYKFITADYSQPFWIPLEQTFAVSELPNLENAFIIGSIHSGYTSGPYMGKLLSEKILGKDVDLSLFDIRRLMN